MLLLAVAAGVQQLGPAAVQTVGTLSPRETYWTEPVVGASEIGAVKDAAPRLVVVVPSDDGAD